ncbi:MAG: hypothetical protein ACTTJE_03765 [Schwartzia sp. (in: firmicutes)]
MGKKKEGGRSKISVSNLSTGSNKEFYLEGRAAPLFPFGTTSREKKKNEPIYGIGQKKDVSMVAILAKRKP